MGNVRLLSARDQVQTQHQRPPLLHRPPRAHRGHWQTSPVRYTCISSSLTLEMFYLLRSLQKKGLLFSKEIDNVETSWCFDIQGNRYLIFSYRKCVYVWNIFFFLQGSCDLTLLCRHRTSSMSSLLGDMDLLVKLSIWHYWHNCIRPSSHLGGAANSSLFLSTQYSLLWPINASIFGWCDDLLGWMLIESWLPSRAGSPDTVTLTSPAQDRGGGNFLLLVL